MTTMMKTLALGAMVAVAAVVRSGFAQDDLDNLLKDLEAESKTETKAIGGEGAAETVKAEEPKAETVKAETVAIGGEGAAETVKAEEPKAETVKAEEPKAEEPKAETGNAEKPLAMKQVDEALSALDELAEESGVEKGAKTAKGEVAAAKPTEDSKSEEAPKAAEAPKPANPDAELLANIAATEKLRRLSLDAQAKREIAAARECMGDGEYTEAVRHYGAAAKLLSERESVKNLRRECDQGIAEGLYRAAIEERDLGRNERAVQLMEKAVDMRHPKARRVLEKWTNEVTEVAEVKDLSDIKHRQNDADYKTEREQINKHLRRSRQYLAVRDMAKALEEVEIVLVNDPYNQEAIRLRNAIQKKRQVILKQERQASRDGMIADVDEAWRPVYAVNAAQLNETTSETVKQQAGEDPERTREQEIENRMKEMRLPTISFKPPATIMDAVEFFRQASVDYDRPDIPAEKRGFNFVLKTPQPLKAAAGEQEETSNDFAANAAEGEAAPSNGLAPIPTITASDITFYEALKLVCDSVDYKFIVRGPVVMVMHKDMSTAEILSRKYNVPESFMERVTTASDEMKQMGGFGNSQKKASEETEETPDRDWKAFFEEMGVKWPEGSSIKHIKSLGKLYVRNTRENLAEFEKVLDELGGQPQLIEIETRFVEVAQEDLNSLGFEWILNSDYNIGISDKVGKALGIGTGGFKKVTSGETSYETTTYTRNVDGSIASKTVANTTSGGTTTSSWTDQMDTRNIGLNAFGGTSSYQNGNRYLSTQGNHISGESKSTNDQFMRVNAFLGEADLSMILHMLAQRSDTDMLSAPKVVTKSGENAVIKVVTEYIYPQDYDVQLQSSSSGSSSSSGGGQSAILAVVEPQNFTMREVGVILDVTPTYSEANGGTIDLELKPSVVELEQWYNYGMRIPFTGNTSSGTMSDIGNIFTGMSTALDQIGATLTPSEQKEMAAMIVSSATTAANNVSTSSSSTMTWYDAPMQQPFFHTRSIDSKVSITPGSTVVMGGLITEQRKAMDDKIPFLGDLPYIGRLFRSHAEQTVKRNLLIFVTGRLITPSGRELQMNDHNDDEDSVKKAPAAE